MKTLVTDLDGTLLIHGAIDDRTVRILKTFQEKNRLVLATGRDLKSIEKILRKLNMHSGSLILLNGNEYIDLEDGEHIKRKEISQKQAQNIVKELQRWCVQLYVVTHNDHYRWSSPFETLIRLVPIPKLIKILKYKKIYDLPEKIEKIAVLGYWGTSKRIKKCERDNEVTYVKIGRFWDEIMPKGCDKANMVRHMMEKYNIHKEDLIVFGDGQNDVEMLKLTSHSYAPHHALKSAKQAAKHIYFSEEERIRIIDDLMEK